MDFASIQENLLQDVLGTQSDCIPTGAKSVHSVDSTLERSATVITLRLWMIRSIRLKNCCKGKAKYHWHMLTLQDRRIMLYFRANVLVTMRDIIAFLALIGDVHSMFFLFYKS